MMFNTFPAVDKSLSLKATSVIVIGDTSDKIFEITIFEPDAETLNKISELNSNSVFNEISIEFCNQNDKETDCFYRQRFQYLDATTFGAYQTFKLRFFISKL